MEEMRKRGSEQKDDDYNNSSSCAGKRSRGGASKDGEGGEDLRNDVMTWLSMDDDDTMSELLNLLDDTTTNADSESETLTRVKFIDNPYSSPLIFQSSSSYVTINGNEESCGSSFSDSESSLMVSVDMGGIVNVGDHGRCEVGAWSSNGSDGGGFFLRKGGEMEHCTCNCNGSDLGDEYALARFLMEETRTVY